MSFFSEYWPPDEGKRGALSLRRQRCAEGSKHADEIAFEVARPVQAPNEGSRRPGRLFDAPAWKRSCRTPGGPDT